MVGGFILTIVPWLMFAVSHFYLKDLWNYEEKARTISGKPDVPLANKLKKEDELKGYVPIAILWILGLYLQWIACW